MALFTLFDHGNPTIALDGFRPSLVRGTLEVTHAAALSPLDASQAKEYHAKLLHLVSNVRQSTCPVGVSQMGWTAQKTRHVLETGRAGAVCSFRRYDGKALATLSSSSNAFVRLGVGWSDDRDEVLQTVEISPLQSTAGFGFFRPLTTYALMTFGYRMQFSSQAALEGLYTFLNLPYGEEKPKPKPTHVSEALYARVAALQYRRVDLGMRHRTTKGETVTLSNKKMGENLFEITVSPERAVVSIFRYESSAPLMPLDPGLMPLWEIARGRSG